MGYPTMIEVEKASRIQLARWYRFLQSPGYSAIRHGAELFQSTMNEETKIMDLIVDRFNKMGGFSPAISKQIGWG